MIKQNISSHSLFHFTSSFSTLKKILDSQEILASYCTEHFWNSYKFAVPMACFCDIPLSQISEHISKYGKFGIGFKSSWETAQSLSSVIYTRSKSNLAKHFGKELYALCDGNTKPSLSDGDIYLLTHIKKYQGGFLHGKDECKTFKNVIFYNEREWRYVPSNITLNEIKIEKEDRKGIEVANNTKYSLPFKPCDIRYIIVSDDGIRYDLIEYLDKLIFVTDRDRAMLKSRILTVPQIIDDF